MAVPRPSGGPRTQHRRGAGRRHGLQRYRPVRRRDRHAGPGPARRTRCTADQLPHHAAVFTGPSSSADRAQPAPRRLRDGGERRPRIPRLRDGDRRRHPHPGGTAARHRIRHLCGRQVAPGARLGVQRGRRPAQLAAAEGLRPVLRRPGRAHQPVPSASAGTGQQPAGHRRPARRLLLHRRHHRPGDLDGDVAAGARRRQAVLPLRRAQCRARSVAGQARGRPALPRPL